MLGVAWMVAPSVDRGSSKPVDFKPGRTRYVNIKRDKFLSGKFLNFGAFTVILNFQCIIITQEGFFMNFRQFLFEK